MVIVVSILALIGTGVGMAAVLQTYGASASPFHYHWRKLLAQASQGSAVTFSPHALRHLFVTEYLHYIKREAGKNTVCHAELAEGFQQIMGWQSPETMQVYDHSFHCGEASKVPAAVQMSMEQGGKDIPAVMATLPERTVPGVSSPAPGQIEDDEDLAFWEVRPCIVQAGKRGQQHMFSARGIIAQQTGCVYSPRTNGLHRCCFCQPR